MIRLAKEERKRKRSDWDDIFGEFDSEFAGMRDRFDELLERLMGGDLGNEDNPLIYGFSMRVGPDGTPVINEFGNTVGPNVPNKGEGALREPLTDVIESDDKVRVIVELPGVEKKDVKVDAADRTLDIEVTNPRKRFSKHMNLPCDVVPDSAKANYKNGVLEVVLQREVPKKRKKPVKVE